MQLVDLAAKDSDVVARIVEGIAELCECDFSEEFITDRVFQCFSSSPQSVIYHAQIARTPESSVVELTTHLQQWASSVVSIPVQFLRLSVDNICALTVSTPQEECPDAVGGSNTSSLVISVAIPVVVVIILALAIGIVVILVIIMKRRHSMVMMTRSKESTTRSRFVIISL